MPFLWSLNLMLPTSRLCEAFTAFKFKCTLRRHDCFLATGLPDSSTLPDCPTSWPPSDWACNYCKLLGVIYTLSTHFHIFSFRHRFRLPRDVPFPLPFTIVTCLSANCSLCRSVLFYILLSHLKLPLKWRRPRCSSLNAFTTLLRYTWNIYAI